MDGFRLLSQLKKPDGGHRGIALSEDIMKLVFAIYVDRLTHIVQALPPGTISSDINVAYAAGRGTDEVLLKLDIGFCKARLEGWEYVMIEYDLWKYFDQIDRRYLLGLLQNAGLPPELIQALARRYHNQTLISDTAKGLSQGIVRGPKGIDQGCSFSPLASNINQSPFLEVISAWMKETYPEVTITAFADNHYFAWRIVEGQASPLKIISELLKLCELIVKESSVRVRYVSGQAPEDYDIGTLDTIDHLTDKPVVVAPELVTAAKAPCILGVPVTYEGRLDPQERVRVINFNLHLCLARHESLAFTEIPLRAHVYSRANYTAAFLALPSETIAALCRRLESYRRKRLHLQNITGKDLLVMAMLPRNKGGLDLTHFQLELFVIPALRESMHLLNMEGKDGAEVREYINDIKTQRFTTPHTRLRLEEAMRRYSQYGILIVDNRQQIIGRALSILQLTLAKQDPKAYGLVELHDYPDEDKERAHSIFVWGGPLFSILVHLKVKLQAKLETIPNLVDPVDLSAHITTSMKLLREIKAILRDESLETPGRDQLHNFDQWYDLASALVQAVHESDIDINQQRLEAGLAPTSVRVWPDWTLPGPSQEEQDDQDPVVVNIDGGSPRPDSTTAMEQACAAGKLIFITTDGSVVQTGKQLMEVTKTTLAGSSVVAIGVQGEPGTWTKTQGHALDVIFKYGVPAALKAGCTWLSSFETEMIGALLWMKTTGGEALRRSHIFIDSESFLKVWKKIISPVALSTFDLTQREVRKQRGSTYLRRLMRLMRRQTFSRTDGTAEEEENALTREVRTWPKDNAEGVRIHEVQQYQIGNTGLSWIKSHQTAARAGPVPIAFAANALADTTADEGAETMRFKCKNGTLLPGFTQAPGEIKMAAGGERIVALYRGEGIYGDAGEVLRTLCADRLFEYLTTGKKSQESKEGTRFKVMTRRSVPLGSPKEYSNVEVEGNSYDLTEDMFSTWTGQAYRLDEPGLDIESSQYINECPLCGSNYPKGGYTTSHALIRCTHPRLRQLRTTLVEGVDSMLTDICPTITAKRTSYNVHRGELPALDHMDGHTDALRHAGDYLLDGDVEAWRGVPLKDLAEWLATSKVGNEKISQDGVKQLLRDITSYIVVKGRHIIKTHMDLVVADAQQQLPPEEADNNMQVE